MEEKKVEKKVEKKEIVLKNLKGKHFFKLSKLAKKLDLDIKKIMSTFMELQREGQKLKAKGKNNKQIDEELQNNNSEVTGKFINMLVKEVFEKLYLAEAEMTDILVDLSDLSKTELEKLEFDEYATLVKQMISDKGFLSFFK